MNATAIASRALTTLVRMGTTYTLTRQAVSVQAATPWKKDSAVDTTQTLTGALIDYEDAQRDGVFIRHDDRLYIVAASGLSIAPQAGDRLSDGSDDLEIISVKEIRAKATAVAYQLQARQ
jgi:hypothetical protein